jgi:ribosomal-protein-alanine N-acetyltransferase
MQFSSQIRPAADSDAESIRAFLQKKVFLHRHLDWHDSLYWINKQPFFLMENEGKIDALLNFTADPNGIAWARTFAVSSPVPIPAAWNKLFSSTLEYFRSNPPAQLAAVSIYEWFADLLRHSGFKHKQDIVTFHHSQAAVPLNNTNTDFKIRRMVSFDLTSVETVDRSAFEPLWQTPLPGLSTAFNLSFYSTVTSIKENIVAYLISTEKNLNIHLARIAVLPEYQGQGIATRLITDFLESCKLNNIQEITLNTQSDNHQSISLYKKMGFLPSGDSYPVLVYQMQ